MSITVEHETEYVDRDGVTIEPLTEFSLAMLVNAMYGAGRITALYGKEDFDEEFEYRMVLRHDYGVEPASLPQEQDEELETAWREGYASIKED
jgi:hypothetical protein